MIVLAAGWYVIAVSRGGEGFFSRQIIQENLARFAGGSGHSHPLYYYLPYLFSQGLPWAIFLPFLFFDFFKHKWFTDDGKLFLALWFAAMFVFFSVSVGKRPVYLLPLYPALSLLLAVWFRDHIPGLAWRKWLYRLIALNAALIGLVLLIITLGALWNHDPAWFFTPIGKMLRAKDRANLFVIRDALADFGGWFTVVAVLSSALWFALGQALWGENMLGAARRLVLIQILLGFVTRAIVMPAMADAKSYRPFMAAVNQRVSAADKLYLYGDFNSDPLVFYRGAPIAFLQAQAAELAQRVGSGNGYIIMPVETWRQLHELNAKLGDPLLRSSGTGPEGDAALVLVQAGET